MFFEVEILLQFNLAFSQRSSHIYQACDGQTEFSWVFDFVNIWCTRKMFYSNNPIKLSHDPCQLMAGSVYSRCFKPTRSVSEQAVL